MQVAIRTDASARIGLGHVQRCLALAQALRRQDAEVVFVTRALGVDGAARIRAAGFAVHELPAPDRRAAPQVRGPSHADWAEVSWQQDAAETAACLRARRPDWVVVDHYAFDAQWHRAISDALAVRIAAIDDLADRPLACALLIDHNYSPDHRAKYASCVAPGTIMLGGPSYALLGPAYAEAPRYECRRELGSIGIFMGGADAGGHTFTALEACRGGAAFKGAVEIVTTRANPRLAELRDRCGPDSDTRISVDLPDLAAFFARHDLQIGAGGGATWERCCIGAPSLCMVVAENQRPVLEPLDALGVLRMVEPHAPAIADAIRALESDSDGRCELGRRAGALVDGRGAERVSQEMVRQ